MRIASFNVENLFDRARALNLDTWADGKPILEKHARINRLLNRPVYSEANKTAIRDLLLELGLEKRDDGGDWVILRQNRGKLVKRPQAGGLEIVANGRGDWIGWVELKKEPVNELAMDHTAMVIRDLAADVLGVVEAETRIALDKFSRQLLEKVGGTPYEHVMVIDGNDDRGIDVGLMCNGGLRDHVHPIPRGRHGSVGDGLQPRLPRVPRDDAERRAARRAGQPLEEQGLRRRVRLERETEATGETHQEDLRAVDRRG